MKGQDTSGVMQQQRKRESNKGVRKRERRMGEESYCSEREGKQLMNLNGWKSRIYIGK